MLLTLLLTSTVLGLSNMQLESPSMPSLPLSNASLLFKRGFTVNHITRNGAHLYDGANIFRFISYNVPGFLLVQDRPSCPSTLYGFNTCQWTTASTSRDANGIMYGNENGKSCIVNPIPCQTNGGTWVPPTLFEQESAMQAIAGMFGRVVRTYTLGFGSNYHVSSTTDLYEPAMVAMDQALDVARRYGVRLIIPLVNNHWPGTDIYGYGDVGMYCSWFGKDPTAFFTDSTVINAFKAILTKIMNRLNTVNGIRYGDDPTVLAWETGNELGGWDGPAPASSWTLQIAALLKQLAPNTLVADGTMGGLDATSRYPQEVLTSPNVDMYSCHYYWGSSDEQRVARDANFFGGYSKVFFVGEWGLTSMDVYQSLIDLYVNTFNVAGALIWSLRYHSRDGGFYDHSESSGQWAYHVPGYPTSTGFDVQEQSLVTLLRNYAMKINGMTSDPGYPIPPPPTEITGARAHPYYLVWQGSPWAASYAIYRGTCAKMSCSTPDTWTLIATGIQDNVLSGSRIYKDSDAVVGNQYWYWIFPVGVAGTVGQGTQIGPMIC